MSLARERARAGWSRSRPCTPRTSTGSYPPRATVLEQLHHANILRLHDCGRSGDRLSGAGTSMGRSREDSGATAVSRPGRRCGCHSRVASALAHAHKHRIIHGDIKPGNLLISRRGESCSLISDLHCAGSTHPTRGPHPGTPRYMAPEQAKGNPRPPRRHILPGAVLYEMLAGTPAFPGDARLMSSERSSSRIRCHWRH